MRTNQLARLPIAKIESFDQGLLKETIINLVDQLLRLNESKSTKKLQTEITQIDSKIDYIERRINDLVYQLYGLTKDEMEIVKKSIN